LHRPLERQYPEANAGIGVRLVPMHEEIVGDVRRPLLILFGTAVLVLLIACANVANLLLARAASRQKELAIRTALGAGRRRLIAQLLTESLVLAAAGGAAGLLLAAWGVQALLSLAPSNLPRLTSVRVDTSVILYTSLASLFTGLVFGAAAALQSATATAGEFLKERGRTESPGASGRRLRDAFAIGEIAVALVLVIGAGLLVRSVVAMNKVERGFDPRGILAVRVELPRARYSQDAQVTAFFNDLASRLARPAWSPVHRARHLHHAGAAVLHDLGPRTGRAGPERPQRGRSLRLGHAGVLHHAQDPASARPALYECGRPGGATRRAGQRIAGAALLPRR
jgi:putative ABC transport system permease protein